MNTLFYWIDKLYKMLPPFWLKLTLFIAIGFWLIASLYVSIIFWQKGQEEAITSKQSLQYSLFKLRENLTREKNLRTAKRIILPDLHYLEQEIIETDKWHSSIIEVRTKKVKKKPNKETPSYIMEGNAEPLDRISSNGVREFYLREENKIRPAKRPKTLNAKVIKTSKLPKEKDRDIFIFPLPLEN